MPHLILFDDEVRHQFLPFTFTRPMCELRVGITTIREKWEAYFGVKASFVTQDYLSQKYPMDFGDDNFVINGAALPSPELYRVISQLDFNEALQQGDEFIAARIDRKQFQKLMDNDEVEEIQGFDLGETPFIRLRNLWDIFKYNDQAIREDYARLTKDRDTQTISATNTVIGDQLFIEEGAEVEASIFNTNAGPIYIGKNAKVLEGSALRGPIAIGDGAVVKMGAKIYGATTIGTQCKVGGEINNSVFLANSNKGHDGYLGNAVIGEWCNLGADSNNSNLKNTYAPVRLWNYPEQDFVNSGEQFIGLFMGDHSKCGINTMFNTGTVVGVFANIFGGGFPPKFIPSFFWGGAEKSTTYVKEKAWEVADAVMVRRQQSFTKEEQAILEIVFDLTEKYRTDQLTASELSN